jgi:quercetin dioxygenase-like cupin family protein
MERERARDDRGGDTTVKKVESSRSPAGDMGQLYLVSGKHVAMRLWDEAPGAEKGETTRDYETVGYVIQGRAELELAGQTLLLAAGDAWLVPRDAPHRYRILERFQAVEATCPPGHVHARDAAPAE